MAGVSKLAQGAWTWDPDFTGPGIILCWGGGESGESGQALTRGGDGGDSGWLCVDLQDFVSGPTGRVTGYNGAGGAQVAYASGGAPANPGEASYFGGGTTCKAPGGGDTVTVAQGRAKIPSGAGGVTTSGTWSGSDGGTAPSQGAYPGGAGGVNGTQSSGTAGSVPGGGGSGGGQSSGGFGSAGANGGCIIIPASDATLPGYKLIGIDESYNFSTAGTYDDMIPTGDGLVYFEAVGSGGGGRGGDTSALQGGHGGSGGAHMWRLRQVFKDVAYRRVVPAGGAGGAVGFGTQTSGADGADTSWNLTPLRVIQKRLTGNVATIWTCAPGSSTPQKHGLLVGETTVVSGVDATFNGSVVVTAVAADRLSFSYAKTAANVTQVAVTPSGTVAGALATPFLLAKGGKGATANYNTGTLPEGGKLSEGIGDGGSDGGRGCYVRAGGAVNTTNGGGSGGGALPLGGDGAWGGGDRLNATGNKTGDTGIVPGGGGGGGAGQTAGNAGPGARGAAVARWILELHGIWVGGVRQSVTRVKKWTGSPGSEVSHEALLTNVWNGGVAHSSHRVLTHPESLKRRYPPYLPANYKGFFDRETGCFNWKVGASHMLTKLDSGDYDIMVFGDSVAEGWTSFDGVATGTKDFPKAFSRFARDYISGLVAGLAKGGTGMIRPASVSGADPQWTITGWSAAGHYVSSSNVGHIATLAPGLDSAGVQITGNKVAVAYSGGGITVRVNGTVVGTGAATANLDTIGRFEYTAGSVGAHSIDIRPTAAVATRMYGASLEKTGIRVHNMSQGGAKAGGGTGQSYWGPSTGMTTVDNMTFTYVQSKFVSSSKGQPECFLIFLGGNDSNADTDAATIKAAFKRIADAIRAVAPNADIILMPDVWTADRNVALMDLCISDGLAMLDFFFLSRGLTEIFGKGYNGDVFGHLNSATGSPWAARMMRDAFLHDPS